ncbi:dual specificity protein phosphatase family protein [Actinomadura graeca]|uniref:Dual specificity protein phosphatase family protein n=1 Tax=Actinomadura graeca TaxID=2750812 RepID=A0ABX8QP38_9ACTN|nr:dual specificity protein phosphatase family protein [Actinomadura graeca]QXJ20373.1 dual specificity protein phosphatase family protein [Actinomadura graeca]
MRWRRRILGWSLIGGATVYALAWMGVSLTILGMSGSARADDAARAGTRDVPGIGKFAVVDGHLWRGAAPTGDGYRWLASQGVRTVVDLRAEDLPAEVLARPGRAGLTVVRIPMRDGQAPSPAQVERFLAEVGRARGPVFVHCGAGVGRTGAMAAAYLVRTGRADAAAATRRSLALGPPTLEQLSFMRGLGGPRSARPPAAVVALSRVADSPRRSWARLTG